MSKEINLDDDDIFKDMGDDFGDFNIDEPKLPTGREAILEAPKTAIAGAANAIFGEGKRRQLLAKAMPDVGDSTFTCEQAGRNLMGTMTVSSTPNPSFRRVDALVMDGESVVLKLSTIVGRF